jgi:hypothetical protein
MQKFGLYPYHLVPSLAKASFARVLLRLGGRGRKRKRKKVKRGPKGKEKRGKGKQSRKILSPIQTL